jgi:hypothetical protein
MPSIFAAKSITLVLLILLSQRVLGQFADNFSDGDFSTNPTWSGNANVFTINASLQLQLNNSVAATSYLSVPFTLNTLDELNWEFFIRQSFAPSSGNYGRVYLVSDQANLTGSLNGYYLQFGEAGTLDAIELFRQTGTTSTSVCRAANGRIATSVAARVKVSRDATGLWRILIDYNGGTAFVEEVSGVDVTYTSSAFLGVVCVYTSTNANKFFFDDFSINPFVIPDTSPPTIGTVSVQSRNELSILFSEEVDRLSAETATHYSASNGIGNPASAALQADDRTVLLSFPQDFPNGIARSILVEGVMDLAGNTMSPTEKEFMYFNAVPAVPNDIIITEIFADPAPSVGLPEVEFLEIFNRSSNPFNLNGWKITDGSSTGTLTSFILLPDQYLILAPASSSSQLMPYGNAMGLTIFPTLNNSGDAMVLLDANGTTINSVHYFSTWYGDADKQGGGYTLERIDLEDFCQDSENWIASNNPTGGTPGIQNSVFEVTPDIEGPKMISCVPLNPTSIELTFDERLSAQIPVAADFSIQPSLTISSIVFSDGLMKKLRFEFAQEINVTTVYTIVAQNVFDCPGNPIQPEFNSQILKLDNTAPAVNEVEVLSANELRVAFSESMHASALDPLNYSVSTRHPREVVVADDGKYVLRFDISFTNGESYNLHLANIHDLAGNMLVDTLYDFRYFVEYPTLYKDIIVTEILADPSPSIGLPEIEFVEIYNRSENPVDLSGWTVADDGEPVSMASYVLLPDEYLILCAASQAYRFASLGNVLGIAGFPSLNNSGDSFVLKHRQGHLIDSVHYDNSWFKDQAEGKEDGGWTLELIYPENICAEKENWIASEDPSGGTPGRENSVLTEKPDLTGPGLTKVVAQTPNELIVTFGEKLDRAVPTADRFVFEPSLPVAGIAFEDATLTTFRITLSSALSGGTLYRLIVNNIFDCAGNVVDPHANAITFALPERAESTDVVVNEILFNPTSTGVDFIEICNRSAKYIDLRNWKLASENAGELVNLKTIPETDLVLAPHQYLVFTEDSNLLKGEYMNGVEENFIQMDIPSLPDDEGSVVLIDEDGNTIDFMTYRDDYHSVFIQDDEGVSLERLNAAGLSLDRHNWKSASTAVRATPGHINSNAIRGNSLNETIVVSPEVFIPSVGQPGFTTITYKFDRPGYIGSLSVFDSNGNEVKTIARNELLTAEGFFRWDGDRDDGTKARIGSYLIYLEVFDETGAVKTYRRRVVVSTRF